MSLYHPCSIGPKGPIPDEAQAMKDFEGRFHSKEEEEEEDDEEDDEDKIKTEL